MLDGRKVGESVGIGSDGDDVGSGVPVGAAELVGCADPVGILVGEEETVGLADAVGRDVVGESDGVIDGADEGVQRSSTNRIKPWTLGLLGSKELDSVEESVDEELFEADDAEDEDLELVAWRALECLLYRRWE